MKAQIELDDKLVEQVIRLGHFSSKKAAVNAALEEYAKLLKRRQLLELRGKVKWEGDLEQRRAARADSQV
jgi:Arc/MetJ family transcription regulator